jgi:signal transduction histidine kinase/PAS domain-containing protein
MESNIIIGSFLPEEDRIKIAGEFSENAYWEWRPYLRSFTFCRFFPEMLGYNKEELPQQMPGWLRLIHHDDKEKVLDFIVKLFRINQPVSFECRIRQKNGNWKWIHTRIKTKINKADRKSLILIGVNIVIEREKQFEADLILNKKRLTLLLENFHQGVLLESSDRKIIFINMFLRKMLRIPFDYNLNGFDCSIAAGQSSRLFKDPEGFIMGINKCIDSGEPIIGEELQLKDGRIFERDFLPVKTMNKSHGNFWLYRDITERKLAEKKNNALSEQNILMAELGFRLVSSSNPDEVYQLLLRQLSLVLPDVIIIAVKYHADGSNALIYDFKIPKKFKLSNSIKQVIIELKNRSFERIPETEQLENPQVLKKIEDGISGLMGPYYPAELVDEAMEQIGTHEAYNIGIAVRDCHYGNINFIFPGKNRELNHSLIEAIVYQCSIAMSQLDAYEKLAIAMEKAEESNRLKSAFLANMSHEIRTPMNGIVGFGNLLKSPGLDEERINRYVDIINSNASHLLSLINNIMDISKIESGDIKTINNKLNIDDIFIELSRMFQIDKPEVALKFMPVYLPEIVGDRLKIAQVLCNLVSNAIKFTDRGFIRCSAELQNEMVLFCIEDTGSGIKEKDKAKIFDRFVQGEHKTWINCSGAGLGLAISRAYVEIMKGRIWFDSEWGAGSKFYFTIPFTPVCKH